MNNAEKALALARLGVKVFPVDRETRHPVIKDGAGFYDAVCHDADKIGTWFNVDFPDEQNIEVGYWTGGSGLFVVDLDRGKKNGKDGFESVAKAGAGYELGETFSYPTASGGEHRIFQTDRTDLAPSSDYQALSGLDIRAGSSYAVWWGDTVPRSREAFSAEIPEWLVKAKEADTFDGVGFTGSVKDWLEAIPDDVLPSSRVIDLISRIPEGDFGHPEMIELVWESVRLGSERETGIKKALQTISEAWLRGEYNTKDNQRDLQIAIKGAILKAGRVQKPIPTIEPITASFSIADRLGIKEAIVAIERKVSETATESDMARARREMFKLAADAKMPRGNAMGIVLGSKTYTGSVVNAESVWFGDGEPAYHELEDEASELVTPLSPDELGEEAEKKALVARKEMSLFADSSTYSYLSKDEMKIARDYEWWGKEYLAFAEGRLLHFNRPFHVSAMWAALSVIASPWGKLRAQGGRPENCNLYLMSLGESTTGKSEAWAFAMDMIDAYYSREQDKTPIMGDISKLSSISLHRTLLIRDGKPSIVYGDEVQSFFQGVSVSQWQSGILADLSSHYGGEVAAKNMGNDKEFIGKRAKTIFTTFLTGIADQTLEAIGIESWTNGLFYRYLWSFGEPRGPKDHTIRFSDPTGVKYEDQFQDWANEFKRLRDHQAMMWGQGREVDWDEDARVRLEEFSVQIEDAVEDSALYGSIFVSSNIRFRTSIMKCATLIALAKNSKTVSLEHLLVAIDFAGPWHRSMILAATETAKDATDRDAERCIEWIRRRAITKVGRNPWIQRTTVMRDFRPITANKKMSRNEVTGRLLKQLTDEGWLIQSGDNYELTKG